MLYGDFDYFFLFCLLKSSSQYNDTNGFLLTNREENETGTDEQMSYNISIHSKAQILFNPLPIRHNC